MGERGDIELAKLLEAVLAHSPVAVLVMDREFCIVRFNEAFSRTVGRGNEVLGKTPFELIPEPLLSEMGLKDKLMLVRDRGTVIGPETIPYRTVDGKPMVLWHNAFPLVASDGTVAYVVTLLQDATEPVRLKEALTYQTALLKEAADTRKAMLFMLEDLNESMGAIAQAKQEWEATFDAISDPLFIHDAAFKIVRANLAYAAVAGMTPAELTGRPYYEVFPKMKGPCQVCRRAGELQEEEEEEEEEVFISASAKTYRMWAYSLRGMPGGPFTIHIMEDITERKQMERYAGRIEQLATMGQLLGGIAHEMKNPLFILTGRLQLMSEKLANREYDQLGGDLKKIEDAAQRMTIVAQRFLTLGRPYRPQVEACAVQTVLTQTLEFLGNEFVKNQIRVETAVAPDLPPVQADPKQLQEAFLNLMMNAMQAMVAAHGKGTLRVSAQLSAVSLQPSAPVENWIEVRIQDDGPGIAPEHRAKLFEPFFSTKPPEQGTGLGLWTVRTVVMAMKGTVTCESEVGQGATFIVRLPVSEELTQ